MNAPPFPIYLDCAASAPMEPEVFEVVIRTMQEDYGNPSSRTHIYGQRAKAIVERARDQVAAAVECDPGEVVFTSGATESNNLAILGLADFGRRTGRRHIVATAIEHKSVLEPLAALASEGFEVTLVPPTASGAVESQAVMCAVRPETLLVAVMGANNETGVIQPVEDIGRQIAGTATYFHVDAAQLFGKAPSDSLLLNADFISLSGHKLGGPKGVGALICRRRKTLRSPLRPLILGGGQERGLRAGTLPTPLIAGFGVALTFAHEHLQHRYDSCLRYRASVIAAMNELGATINGEDSRVVPNIISVALPGIDAEAVIIALKDLVAVSTGSACTSQSYKHSHVLMAMGLDTEKIEHTIRLSWSHSTPTAPWDTIATRLKDLVDSANILPSAISLR